MQKGAWSEAIEVYRSIVRLKLDNRRAKRKLGEAHRHFGLALLEKGEMDQAIEELGMTLRLDPSDEQARKALVSALLALKVHRR